MQAGEKAARLVAVQLKKASAAAAWLERGAEGEVLHKFRVALRRAVVLLKAYRPWLEGVRRRPLREAARAAGRARDPEVQAAWLRSRGRPADAFDRRRRAAYDALREDILPALRLKRFQRGLRAGGPRESYERATAGLLREKLSELGAKLERVRTARDRAEAHAARLAVKRLRYLLEPLAGAGALVRETRALQTLLGGLHDLDELGSHVRGEAAALARAERARLFERFQASWGPRRRSRLARRVAAFAERLES